MKILCGEWRHTTSLSLTLVLTLALAADRGVERFGLALVTTRTETSLASKAIFLILLGCRT